MSLLKFKCENCGSMISKIRGFRNFNFKKHKFYICKNCGYEYKIRKSFSFVFLLILEIFFMITQGIGIVLSNIFSI